MTEITISVFELMKLIIVSNVLVYILTNKKYCVTMKGYALELFDSVFKD